MRTRTHIPKRSRRHAFLPTHCHRDRRHHKRSTLPTHNPRGHSSSSLHTDTMPKRIGKYELGKTLGTGTFSKVKYGTDTETNLAFAIKVCNNFCLNPTQPNHLPHLTTHALTHADHRQGAAGAGAHGGAAEA